MEESKNVCSISNGWQIAVQVAIGLFFVVAMIVVILDIRTFLETIDSHKKSDWVLIDDRFRFYLHNIGNILLKGGFIFILCISSYSFYKKR